MKHICWLSIIVIAACALMIPPYNNLLFVLVSALLIIPDEKHPNWFSVLDYSTGRNSVSKKTVVIHVPEHTPDAIAAMVRIPAIIAAMAVF